MTTQHTRESEALAAYLRLLEGKGADAATLGQRKTLAGGLLPLLAQLPLDGKLYREQAEKALHGVERGLWPAFMVVAREYYHFWAGDIKAIAAMHANGGYRPAPAVAALPAENLRTLWQNVENEKFGMAETWALKAYVSALRGEGADKPVVETRLKLAKLLLLRLRDAPEKDAGYYRAAVDSALAVFSMKETRLFFELVVREFFHFWIGDPDARNHIVLEQSLK